MQALPLENDSRSAA